MAAELRAQRTRDAVWKEDGTAVQPEPQPAWAALRAGGGRLVGAAERLTIMMSGAEDFARVLAGGRASRGPPAGRLGRLGAARADDRGPGGHQARMAGRWAVNAGRRRAAVELYQAVRQAAGAGPGRIPPWLDGGPAFRFSGSTEGMTMTDTAMVSLTDGATITIDASQRGHLDRYGQEAAYCGVTLGGNRTMAAPLNPQDGARVTAEAETGLHGFADDYMGLRVRVRHLLLAGAAGADHDAGPHR